MNASRPRLAAFAVIAVMLGTGQPAGAQQAPPFEIFLFVRDNSGNAFELIQYTVR